MTIDADGSGGNPFDDPYFQPDTSYHHNGEALNPYTVPFIVLPPDLIRAVSPAVLGCKAKATNLANGISVDAIVGDVGPETKLGEASCLLAKLIGLSGHPNTGGTLNYDAIMYQFWPGKQICLNGIIYELQPY